MKFFKELFKPEAPHYFGGSEEFNDLQTSISLNFTSEQSRKHERWLSENYPHVIEMLFEVQLEL